MALSFIEKNIQETLNMNIPFFDYLRQYKNIETEINMAVQGVFASGQLFFAAETRKFEKSFAEFTGSKNCVALSSGTDALYISLKALGIGFGDEVITVANTAVPTISAVRMTGAMPVFADVCVEDGLINPEMIEPLITSKTKALLPVHLYGNACSIEEIQKIAEKYDLFLIEDCAQACGTTYKNKHVGNFSDIGCFSFYPTKNLGAYGDGGAIITNDDGLAEKIRKIRFYGFDASKNSVLDGVNGRIDELQAGILNVKIKYLNGYIQKRKQIAGYYLENINNPFIILPNHGEEKSWHLFVIRTLHRTKFQEYLKKHGIGFAHHYLTPVHRMETYAKDYLNVSLPNTEKRSAEIISLPMFPELSENEIIYICETINNFDLK